jgi:hypothetical protein
LLVHIGDPSSNQATTLESQLIHMIQYLSGQTLRGSRLKSNAQPKSPAYHSVFAAVTAATRHC